ncbi:hypothetical protein EUX98_g5591 [Antrodiella citrinella]|uniref:Vacuolar sorting protein Vps3844 C-terminal domain-containing protein n=1 Tax=Antrodiella citrinella TaxID=2447956 RepID=A0A4S4MRD2_9APHY|nr:hypothetical protein EUX98_g5591 [Antrodiella citrinella]
MKSAFTLLRIVIVLATSSYASANTRVYLHPSPIHAASNDLTLTPAEASRAVAKFVGLDLFEPAEWEDESEMEMYANYEGGEIRLGGAGRKVGSGLGFGDEDAEPFVSKGMGRTLVIGVDNSGDMEDIIPHTLSLTFAASESSSPSFSFSWSSLSLPTLVERATELYTSVWSSTALPQAYSEPKPRRVLDIFDLPRSEASASFLADLGSLVEFIEWDEVSVSDADAFGAFDLSSLKDLKTHYGLESEQYRAAASAIRATINSAMIHPNLKLVVISSPAQTTHHKRQQPPSQSPLPVPSAPPQHPISGVSTCYTSLDACSNSTNSCSSHGQCVSASKAGKTCFVCTCTATKSINGNGKTKTTLWAGEQCERIDVSGEFVLLVGTVIGMILLVVGSISLLTGVGDEKLPQVLAEGNVPSKHD